MKRSFPLKNNKFIIMKCPYCKLDLVKSNKGELYCKKGDCYFSKIVSGKFDKIILSENHITDFKPYINNKNSHLFCVNCGDIMKFMNEIFMGELICINCGIVYDKSLHYNIIELNPHK